MATRPKARLTQLLPQLLGGLAVTKKPLVVLERLPAASRAVTEAMYWVAG